MLTIYNSSVIARISTDIAYVQQPSIKSRVIITAGYHIVLTCYRIIRFTTLDLLGTALLILLVANKFMIWEQKKQFISPKSASRV